MLRLAPGMTLQKRYTVTHRIGVGGIAEVWRATDNVLGRSVAVKLLRTPTADPMLRSAPWHEARAAAGLAHPGVAQVHDYGETVIDGAPVAYLVMELIAGESLALRLQSGPLPWQLATKITGEIASALAAAHAAGIFHGDIKPANVMLGPNGVKVFDFGVASLASAQPGIDGRRMAGTPAYAAPEYLRTGRHDAATDVYALGLLLHEALTGRPLHTANTWDDAARLHASRRPVPELDVPGLPRSASRLCRAMLSPNPAERPSAAEIAASFGAAAGQPAFGGLAGSPVAAGSPNPAEVAASNPTRIEPPVGTLPGGTLPGGTVPGGAHGGAFPAGVARVSGPPTMIEPRAALPLGASGDAAEPRRSASRGLVIGLAAAVVVLAVALVAVAASLLSSPSGGGPAVALTGPSGTTQPPLTTPATTTPPANDAAAVIAQVSLVIDTAVSDGRLDEDDAKKLRERLNDLADRINEPGRARKAVRDFVRTINSMVDDDKIDRQTADQLLSLLNSLTGGSSGD